MKYKMKNNCKKFSSLNLLNNIKKINIQIFILLLLAFLFGFSINYSYASFEDIDIISNSAILLDNTTNKVLYAKNENEKMYPASTTKILTAILTLENSKLDDIVTVSYNATMSIPEGYSTANLQIGEQLTVEQLLQLLLVHSANDSANVLAEHIGGSIESFVSMMNTKANELGLNNSHFTNTFGLHDPEHYTTASDLATLMKYCIRNNDFRKISGSASCAIPATNKYGTRLYKSTNDLIIPNTKSYYPYITAGKTGFTTQAGDCLVSCSYKDNLELICVILGGKTISNISSRFSDTKNLYAYAYNNYSLKTLVDSNFELTKIEITNATADTKTLTLLAEKSIIALVENTVNNSSFEPEIILNENIKAPILEGDILGTAKFKIDNSEYEVNLIASHDVEESIIQLLIIAIFIALSILYILYRFIFKKKKKKYKSKAKWIRY